MRLAPRPSSLGTRRDGYVLIAVLLVVVVLSLAAYQFVEAMTSEYRSAVRTTDTAQARLNAVSGIHYAAGMLANRDAYLNQLNGNPFDNANSFADVVVRPDPTNPRREGRFAIVTVFNNGSGYETRYGVSDEAGKLNINALIALDSSGQTLHDALMKLPNMTEEIADAIVDWVDPDDDSRPAGAESSYYLSLPNAYRAKNGPLNSVEELLLVRGVTPQLLFGNDRNRNGVADDSPDGNQQLDRGWAEFLTVHGRELNVNTNGVVRVNVNESEDLNALYDQLNKRVGQEMAAYIMAYKMFTVQNTTSTGSGGSGGSSGGSDRDGGSGGSSNTQVAPLDVLTSAVTTALSAGGTNRRRITSLFTLRTGQVQLPKLPDQPGQPPQPTYVYPSPLADPNKFNQLIATLMDELTTTTNVEIVPRLNVNTAPREVLLGLPGLQDADADNIINSRDSVLDPTNPAYTTGTWLMTTGGMNPSTFQKIEKYVTGRTMIYRVQAIGYSGQGGPVARVEAVIDINQGAPRFLTFRDLTDLDSPRGFEPPRK